MYFSSGSTTHFYGQPVLEARRPPPQLPGNYQPDCPGDGYLWTPGYWSYSDQGYYCGCREHGPGRLKWAICGLRDTGDIPVARMSTTL